MKITVRKTVMDRGRVHHVRTIIRTVIGKRPAWDALGMRLFPLARTLVAWVLPESIMIELAHAEGEPIVDTS